MGELDCGTMLRRCMGGGGEGVAETKFPEVVGGIGLVDDKGRKIMCLKGVVLVGGAMVV